MLTIHVCRLGAYLNQRGVGRQRVFFVVYHWTSRRRRRLAQLLLWTWSRLKICGCWRWWSLSLGWISGLSADCRPDKSRKAHTNANTRTRTHQINTSGPHTAWVWRPSMTRFDYSVLKQQVTGLPRMSSVRLASVQRRQFRIHGEQQAGKMPDLQVSCPIIDIKWAQDVMSSSRKSSIPLSGRIKLSVAAEGQISVAGHTLPPGGNVWKITHGTLACLIKAAMLILIKAIKAKLIKTIRNRCACMCAQWFPWLPVYFFWGLNIYTVCIT